jgi:hypothetical protein
MFDMSADPTQDKDELLKGLEQAQCEAKRIEDAAKEALQNARLVRDTAPQLRILYQEKPVSGLPAEEWARQNQNIQSWLGAARSMSPIVTQIATFGAVSQTVMNTAVSGVMVAWPHTPVAPPPPPAVEKARANLFQTLDRFPLLAKALASLKRLKLDVRTGKNPSTTLLEEARSALEQPTYQDGGAVGVLVTLRECIDASITEMVRRRPKQESASGGWKGKVIAIGRQCARPGLPADHFDRVGQEIDKVMNDLSAAKQAALARPQILEEFNRGLLALNSLLDSIDELLLR